MKLLSKEGKELICVLHKVDIKHECILINFF